MPPSTLTPLSGRYLSFAEREAIALLRAQKCRVCTIARRLARASSSISCELRRNAATRSGGFEYRASTAQWHAERKAKRPKVAKLAANEALRQYVQARLAGTLAVEHRETRGPRCALERASSWPPARSPLGHVMES
jgi:IS30 family transposase